MGTRIVVMKDGFIQQVDTPQTLYENHKLICCRIYWKSSNEFH
jgi:ABC-type sugar transport system ATPase subunit